MTNPSEFFWFRIRKIFSRWHVLTGGMCDADFQTWNEAANYGIMLKTHGYVNADYIAE